MGLFKKPWILSVSVNGTIVRAAFDSEEAARDARQNLHQKWKAVQRNRPNDPELCVYRVICKSGEIDFDLLQVRTIYLTPGTVSSARASKMQ